MAHQSFAKDVRDAVREAAAAGSGEVNVAQISCLLHLQTRIEHKRLLNTLSDLSCRGKVVRVRQGVYAPATAAREPDKREVMWRLLRMRRTVTVADLQEMAGVSPHYAMEWLAMLVKREVAIRITPANQNHPHSWRLIKNDLAEMPVNEERAEKLRKLRRKNKAAITGKLDVISTALGEVRQLLKTMEDE